MKEMAPVFCVIAWHTAGVGRCRFLFFISGRLKSIYVLSPKATTDQQTQLPMVEVLAIPLWEAAT